MPHQNLDLETKTTKKLKKMKKIKKIKLEHETGYLMFPPKIDVDDHFD